MMLAMDTRFLFSERLHQSDAPFSHFVQSGTLGFVAGIIGQRPSDGRLVSDELAAQAHAMFDNLSALLDEVGLGVERVLRTTLYLVDYADFGELNEVYRARLRAPYPVRTTLQVAGLPLGARVQIDAVVAV